MSTFREAIEKAGLTPPADLPPGILKRFAGAGKPKGDKAGWAILFEDELGGAYGDWASGLDETWQATRATTMTPKERETHQACIAKAQRIRREEEAKEHAKAAKQAQSIYDQAFPAPASHPYLLRKGVQAHRIRCGEHNNLTVPVMIDGAISSVQRINDAGEKLFFPGGKTKGGSYTIGDLTGATTVLIGEGFATGASLHEATGLPVVVAFSAPNLTSVAEQLRRQYPTATIILCGDNDLSGTGQKAAREAAEAIGGLICLPETVGHDWDWNDVHLRDGLDAVKAAIVAAMPKAAWYQKREMRQRGGGDKGLVKELADEIQRTDHFAKDAGGRLYAFTGGVYRPGGARVVAQHVKRILELNHDTQRWSTHRAAEVVAYLAVDAPILWDRPPLDTLNLQNGLLNLKTGELTEPSPEHYSPIQLPMIYNPAASCEEWDSFIADVFPEDCHTLAYEIVAWLLCPDTSIQKAFLLRGDGENGKSTYLAAVTAALGTENVSGLDLQKLETERFSTWRLLGKLANICPDLPSDHLTSTSIFKAIVGGDRILGEYKYGDSFEFSPFARLLFSANHFPQSKDSSYAFFRRWIVIPFDRTITPEQKRAKPDILARLTSPAELSGLLNRCLAVLPVLRRRGGFVQTEAITVARAEFQEATDPLAVWLDRFTVLDSSGVVLKTDLSLMYSAESEKVGRPVVPARTLYAAIKRLRPAIGETMRRVNGNPRDVFVGIRVREKTDGPTVSCNPCKRSTSTSELMEGEEGGGEERRGIGHSAYTANAPYAKVDDGLLQSEMPYIEAGPL